MAEDKKFLDRAGLRQALVLIKEHVSDNYVAKETGKSLVSNTLINKLENIEAGGQVNLIESIKVNGTALTITDKAVEIGTTIDSKIDAVKTVLQADIETVATNLANLSIKFQIVGSLPPVAEANMRTIYLVLDSTTGKRSETGNVYAEFIVVDKGNGVKAYERIGDTHLSLDDYAKITNVNAAIAAAKEEVLTNVAENFVKNVDLHDKVKILVDSEEFTSMINRNIATLTDVEIKALFIEKPIMVKADGTQVVCEDAAEAVISATSGDTVVLGSDVEIDANIEVAQNVIIDLNGFFLEVKETE